MSTFAELCALPNPGMAILVEVSTDRFATILSVSGVEQRWSTVAGFFNNPSANFYGGGIASVGRLQRSLGTDGTPAAGTVSLVLDNTDGAFDWLTARGTVESTVFKARLRVYVAAFDPANPTDNQVQLAGTYIPLDNPQRDESRVFLELADDVLGDAADLSLTPSLASWLNNASTTNVNTPWAASPGNLLAGVDFASDQYKPLPLAFGTGEVPLTRVVRGDIRFHPFVICCTTNTGVGVGGNNSYLLTVRSQVFGNLPSVASDMSSGGIWALDRSPFNIVRDGRTWRIWLVQFDTTQAFASSFIMNTVLEGQFGPVVPASVGGAPPAGVDKREFTDALFSKLGKLTCLAYPLSSHTYPSLTGLTGGFSASVFAGILCSNVARDLLQQYCRGSVVVDVPSFDAVAAASPNARASVYIGDIGSIGFKQFEPSVIAEAGQTRGILKGLCQAGSFDLTTLQAGQVRALANTATYEAYVGAAALSAQRLEETRIVADSLRVRTPSQGQRWAPYNRVFIDVGTASGDLPSGRQGPFDHEGNITAWGRPMVRVINAAYSDISRGLGSVHDRILVPPADGGFALVALNFPVESAVRPVVSFRYGLEAMQLNLGDYFILSLTRGGQTTLLDTYVDIMWKVEALNFIPDTGQVEVTAVWAGDVLADIPFLLDDETGLVTRTTSAALGAACTTVAGTNGVTFSAGSLIVAGVAVGDILVLQDAAEATESFDRNRGVRITARTATTATLAENIATSATVATWKILRGATTYPGPSDAGYIPNGGRMFGKAADGSQDGQFSDATAANKMLGG